MALLVNGQRVAGLGKPGVGIKSIERTGGDGTPGTDDIYTITLTNGTTADFTVHNGADGEGGGGGGIFGATYGTTTYTEIKNAHDPGLGVLLKRNNRLYPLSTLDSTCCYFTCLENSYLYSAMLMKESYGGQWSDDVRVIATAPEWGEVGQVIAWDDYDGVWKPITFTDLIGT